VLLVVLTSAVLPMFCNWHSYRCVNEYVHVFVDDRCELSSESFSALESATVKFLSRCCWCHPSNQKLLSRVLCDVISQQKTVHQSKDVLWGLKFWVWHCWLFRSSGMWCHGAGWVVPDILNESYALVITG